MKASSGTNEDQLAEHNPTDGKDCVCVVAEGTISWVKLTAKDDCFVVTEAGSAKGVFGGGGSDLGSLGPQ